MQAKFIKNNCEKYYKAEKLGKNKKTKWKLHFIIYITRKLKL